MQTEAIRVALRLRTPWEAVDLGVRMVRGWWLPIMGSWLALFVPAVAAATLLTPSPGWAIAVLWWLRPLFDRAVLNVLAQGVFGPVPRWADTLSTLPALVLRSGLLFSMTLLRLTPQRSLTLPILQLENLRGGAYSRRARTLSGRDMATAIGLTTICSTLEAVMILGTLGLVANLASDPMADSIDLQGWLDTVSDSRWSIAIYALAMTLVEPFYVGGGFGLYLNRRIELEGWDIEVAFRAIARRHERASALRAARVLALALVCFGATLAAQPARADEPLRCAAERAADAKPCIERVLADAEFEHTETREGWRLRKWLRELFEERENEPSDPLALGAALASILRVLAYVVLIFGGLALIGALARFWIARQRPLSGSADAPPVSAVEEPRPELPADVVGAALAGWASDPGAALGLLYAGARAHLVERLQVALPDGATERECERLARHHAAGALADDFGALTHAWIFCAYAHRLPSAELFHQLCARWRNHLVSA